jgi:hypothetical protein
LFFFGWGVDGVVVLRSKLISEAQRGATGQRPILNLLQKEIETTRQIVENKSNGASVNIYMHHDKQDASFAGLEAALKGSQYLVWPQDTFEAEKPYTEPDLAIIQNDFK